MDGKGQSRHGYLYRTCAYKQYKTKKMGGAILYDQMTLLQDSPRRKIKSYR